MAKLTILAVIALIPTISGFSIKKGAYVTRSTSILDRNNAEQGQFPYQVSIKRTQSGLHNCGGSIINSKWILTAAHCVIDSLPSDWFIFAGEVSLSAEGVIRHVSQIKIHPNYDTQALYNDIALLELEDELEFSAKIQPIELETEDVAVVDCVVSGWNLHASGTTVSDILQYIHLKTITSEQCSGVWGSLYISAGEVCTITTETDGFCRDSGGPLVADARQIGIAAWGGSSCVSGRPDVYTKVSAFINWIQANVHISR